MAKKRKLQHDASVPTDSSTRRQAMSFFDLPAEMRNAIYELLAAACMGEKILCWQEGLHTARPRLLRISRQFAEEAKGYIDDTRWRLTPIDLAKPRPFRSAEGNLNDFIGQPSLKVTLLRPRSLRIPLTVPSGSIRLDTLTEVGNTLLQAFIAQTATRNQPLKQEEEQTSESKSESSIAPSTDDDRDAFCYTITKQGEIEFEVLDARADDMYASLAELASWPSTIDPVLLGPTSQAWDLSRSWNSVMYDIFLAVMSWRSERLWKSTWRAWREKIRKKRWGLRDLAKREKKA